MRRFLPSLSALQAFEAAARYQSFTKAGEELAMTQSGVSRQVQNLEAFLGMRLFERVGSRLTLTEAGNKYFHEIAQNLNRLEEVSIDVVRGRKADASLMIGASPTLAARLLVPRLGYFANSYPDVPIEITAINQDIDFSDTRVDIAILRGFGTWAKARASLLFEEELIVIASPDLVRPDRQYMPSDFAHFPTLQNASRPNLWLRWLRASQINYHGTIQGIRFTANEMLIQAAAAGIGIAIVPRHFVNRELQRGDLHCPFGGPVRSGEAYWVVQSEREAQNSSAVTFRNWILLETKRERASATELG